MSGIRAVPAGWGITPQWLIPDWPAPPTVRSLSTLRPGGSSRHPFSSLNLGGHVGDAAIAVTKNRRSLREAAGLPAEPSWLTQVHGTRVVDLDRLPVELPSPQESADAAITGRRGRVCAILTADCLPVLLAADSGDRVGAAHAGWRGLAAGVIESAVQALAVPPRELMVWLGPAIGPKYFEIGPEVRAVFLQEDPGAEGAFVRTQGDRFTADLNFLARRRLSRLGIERVYGGGECTYSQNDKYFSHRRDGTTGRQASLIWLEEAPGR